MAMPNPLLDFSGLPRFDAIRPAHVTPAIDTLLAECRAVVAELEKPMQPVRWGNFIKPLENATERLGRAWSNVSHLNAVVDAPELRAAYNENLPKVTEFWTALGQNLALFDKYKALQNSAEYVELSAARKKIIENALRDFRLGGAELPEAEKKRFAEIQEEQAALATKFSENVLDAINHYALFVETEAELAGLPEDVKHAARAAAEKDGKNGYKFTLHYPSFYPALQYADNRALRETLYRANATKASELGENPEWNNAPNIIALLKLRKEEAQLLGYQNFAEVSLVPKMAESPAQVKGFLDDLAKRARPYAEKDMAELRTFARDELGLASLEAWDIAYASEKLREQRYAFSEEEVKQYFPEARVIEGLFRLIQTLFSVTIQADVAPVWHKDVKFFRVERDGKVIGQFYLDLYARNGKRSGAWMDDARGRRKVAGNVQTPLTHLICNFTEPMVQDGKLRPALFTHDEVITLFHEFGHGLNHMLTMIDDLSVSGIGGVEWDAVELPSQFMENFCWEWDVLSHMTAHAETGAPLPKALFDKMIAAKNFQSGMQMLRQIEFATCDMRLHDEYDPAGGTPFQSVLDAVREQYAVVIPPSFNRFLQSFSHIFAGGYAAGYYSYKWAEVLSADAYAAFEEARELGESILSVLVGKKFQDEILAVGGSRPALASFVAFRGREPKIDALLRHNGMQS
ncbi:MAG: M3 family peptidase [Oxalobacter sp.]|nr:MAG: M3 family peptidase [Oxalobacter sp.]